MGLRNFLSRRRTPAAAMRSEAVPSAAVALNPSTPVDRVDLEASWVELREAAEETGMMSFRACNREGSPWQEDAKSVRAIAALIRDIGRHEDASGKDGPPR